MCICCFRLYQYSHSSRCWLRSWGHSYFDSGLLINPKPKLKYNSFLLSFLQQFGKHHISLDSPVDSAACILTQNKEIYFSCFNFSKMASCEIHNRIYSFSFTHKALKKGHTPSYFIQLIALYFSTRWPHSQTGGLLPTQDIQNQCGRQSLQLSGPYSLEPAEFRSRGQTPFLYLRATLNIHLLIKLIISGGTGLQLKKFR